MNPTRLTPKQRVKAICPAAYCRQSEIYGGWLIDGHPLMIPYTAGSKTPKQAWAAAAIAAERAAGQGGAK